MAASESNVPEPVNVWWKATLIWPNGLVTPPGTESFNTREEAMEEARRVKAHMVQLTEYREYQAVSPR